MYEHAYLSFKFQMNKKELEICKFEMHLKNFFYLYSKARSENMQVWILEIKVWKQVWKMTFLLWNRVRIWKTRQHTLTKNSKEYPPSHPRAKNLSISKFAPMVNYTLLGQNCAEIDLRYPQLSFLILETQQQRGYCAIPSKENQVMINFFYNTKVECAILITGWICVALLYQLL